jgi:gamma-glutamyl-gamma-aminobutyrate hydrolase PuuD
MKKVVKLNNNGYKVYVVGGGIEYIRFLWELGYNGATGLGEADIVLFTGGEDVNPALYGEKALRGTYFNEARDSREKIIYEEALKAGIPMVGICRGGQFLNVMNGGRMWQHVTDHGGSHPATEVGVKNPRTFEVTSTHHQMMIPAEKGQVLLAASLCKRREAEDNVAVGIQPLCDTEVVWYDDTNCLCFQPHPEYSFATRVLKDYFDELLDNYIIPATYAAPKKETV